MLIGHISVLLNELLMFFGVKELNYALDDNSAKSFMVTVFSGLEAIQLLTAIFILPFKEE